jgi:hypothetical protein
MHAVLLTVDEFLRGEGLFAPVRPVEATPRRLFLAQLRMIVVCGLAYGAVMGAYNGFAGAGWKQMLLSASKVPVLYFVTFLLCIPSFFVLNTLAGLHGDFPRVIQALLAFQSLAAIVLAALAPITGLMNVSTANYGFIVLWNGVMFAVASLLGQWRMRQEYRVLIAGNPRHRVLLRVWTLLYWFVAIQMAWVLRPFIGDPTKPFQLLRPQAWGNAYMEVIRLVGRVF